MEVSDKCKEIVNDITSIFDKYNLDLNWRQFGAILFVRAYCKEIGKDINKLFNDMKIPENEREIVADIIIYSYLKGKYDQQEKPGDLSPKLREEVNYGLEIERMKRKYSNNKSE